MIYFDTDVLVHFVVYQDDDKHFASQKMIFEAIKNSEFCISFLTMQEFLFVLEKLGIANNIICKNYDFFKRYAIFDIDDKIFESSYNMASNIGFRHINDCIHTVIAEKHCKNLITYNKNDFKKIQRLSNVVITIL